MMTRKLSISIAALLALLPVATLLVSGHVVRTPGSSLEVSDDVLRAPLARALDRAQSRLEAGLSIYVDHRTAEDPWAAEGQYYFVSGIQSFYEVNSLSRGLDQMLPNYQSILGTDWTPTDPLQVLVQPDLDRFNTAGNEWGDARSSYTSSFLAVSHPNRAVVVLSGATDTQTLMWATNAAAQQFVERAFARRLDPWLDQGIGAYFSLYWDWDWGAAQMEELISTGAYIPLEELLSTPIEGYSNGSHARVIELGMLFSFLLHTCEETRTEPGVEPSDQSFQSFLRDSLRGRGVRRHPFRTWIEQDLDAIEQDFRALYGG